MELDLLGKDVTFGRTLVRNVVLTFVSVSLRDLTKTLEKKRFVPPDAAKQKSLLRFASLFF